MNIHRITYNQNQNSASLYFIGCNFRCLGCFWKKIYRRVNFKDLKFLSLEQTMDILRQINPKRVYILTGDAKLNPEFNILPQALYNEFGCEVRLLTNGYIIPEIKGLSHVAMSIKAYTNELHIKYTGKSNKRSLENFLYLYHQGIGLSVSSVFIPEIIDVSEIEKIANFVSQVDKNTPYRIIGYISVPGLDFRRPTFEEVKNSAEIAKNYLNFDNRGHRLR